MTTGLDSKEFQRRVCTSVKTIADQLVTDRSVVVKYVKNLSGKNGPLHIEAALGSAEQSRILRAKFSVYFKANAPARPDYLKDINIRNKVIQ